MNPYILSFVLLAFILNPANGLTLFFIYLSITLIIKLVKLDISNKRDILYPPRLESDADSYLKDIKKYGRSTFKNIIIESHSGNTNHTEIDELIVSAYGIFCIEYKAHRGIIFGSKQNKIWTQCKYNGNRPINNPIHQNYKHTCALKDLLGDSIKSPIKSYVVYTDATDIHVDSSYVFLGSQAMEAEISKQKTEIYSIEECKNILEILAPAVANGRNLREVHIQEVNQYLSTIQTST